MIEICKKNIMLYLICIIVLVVINANLIFASSYTMCSGKEFNTRVKMFLSGNDRNWEKDYTITTFERDYNPPTDKAYYVDISEDKDGTVIAYARDNALYYYTDNEVFLNKDCSYMFDKFIRMRTIDLQDFIYKDIKDTRYMFASCHHLKTIRFKKSVTNKKKSVKQNAMELVEMQGMFFDCQSLINVDISRFDTHHVSNMREVFYKCYNLKNIYVEKANWDITNTYFFDKMFEQCHVLKTNKGRKASDVSEDDYEKYAVAGSGKDVDDKNKIEGFLKDINTEYEDYGERDGSAPVDKDDYSVERTSPTITYQDEPEGNGGDGAGGSGNGSGSGDGGNTPFPGDKSTGFNALKEQMTSEQIIVPSSGINPLTSESESVVPSIAETNDKKIESNVDSIVNYTVNESENIISETSGQINISDNETATSVVIPDEIQTEIIVEETNEVSENISNEIVTEKQSEIQEEMTDVNSSKKVMELDEYLRQQGIEEGKNGDGEGIGGKEEEDVNNKFLMFALGISILVILLLIGMVMFLFDDKKENKKNKGKH